MTDEIKTFWKWAKAGTWPNMEKLTDAEALTFYISLYTQTFPGRTERLMNELLTPEKPSTIDNPRSTALIEFPEEAEKMLENVDIKVTIEVTKRKDWNTTTTIARVARNEGGSYEAQDLVSAVGLLVTDVLGVLGVRVDAYLRLSADPGPVSTPELSDRGADS